MENSKQVGHGLPLLPDEIIFFDIFARLPVESLHRFRCISKFCNSLTSDPQFLAVVNRLSPRRYLISFASSWKWQADFYSLDPESSGKCVAKFVESIESPIYCANAKFINGFMAMMTEHNVVVRNLARKEKFHLPPSPRHFYEVDMFFFHFCYDPETDKYKILRTNSARTRAANEDLIVVGMEYSVFTLGADKYWRNFDHPGLFQLAKSKSVCVNGILYCTIFSTSWDVRDGVIAAFVVKTESFYTISYPKGLSWSRYGTCEVIEAKEGIGVVDYYAEDFRRSCMIRMWIRANGSETWMEHRIEFPMRWESIINQSSYVSFSTNRDMEIVMGFPGCWIFVYNMETRKWRRIEIVGLDGRVILGGFSVQEYVETPLSLSEVLKS